MQSLTLIQFSNLAIRTSMEGEENKPNMVTAFILGPDPRQFGQQKTPAPEPQKPTREPLNMADFNMLNAVGYWLQQSGVVDRDQISGEQIFDSVIDKSNRIKANKVMGQLLDRFSREIEIREGKDGAI